MRSVNKSSQIVEVKPASPKQGEDKYKNALQSVEQQAAAFHKGVECIHRLVGDDGQENGHMDNFVSLATADAPNYQAIKAAKNAVENDIKQAKESLAKIAPGSEIYLKLDELVRTNEENVKSVFDDLAEVINACSPQASSLKSTLSASSATMYQPSKISDTGNNQNPIVNPDQPGKKGQEKPPGCCTIM